MRMKTLWSRGAVAALVLALVGVGGTAWAQEKTYEGDIIAVDGKANTFTVKATKPGEVAEMAFHVGPKAEVQIEGNVELFAELVRGDHVMVTYETAGATNTVHRVHRQRTVTKEMTFAGRVSAVDPRAETLTVRSTAAGGPREMQFRIDPATRLYLGNGDETHLLAQFRPGDPITIVYETVTPAANNIKHVKKST